MELTVPYAVPGSKVLLMVAASTLLPLLGLLTGWYAVRFGKARARAAQAERELARVEREWLAANRTLLEREAEERTRQRIGLDLHASLGQNLGVLIMRVGNLKSRVVGDGSSRLHTELDGIAKLLRDTQAEQRLLAQVNHGEKLLGNGLLPAMRAALDLLRMAGVQVNAVFPQSEPALPHAHRVLLLRILQDILANTTHHAQASRVDVELTCTAGALHLTVTDDGAGFDPGSVRATMSLGLDAIRRRAIDLGGKAAIRSAPGQGTAVTITIPLTDEDTDEHGK